LWTDRTASKESSSSGSATPSVCSSFQRARTHKVAVASGGKFHHGFGDVDPDDSGAAFGEEAEGATGPEADLEDVFPCRVCEQVKGCVVDPRRLFHPEPSEERATVASWVGGLPGQVPREPPGSGGGGSLWPGAAVE
jgi:hypothetical protein